MLLTRFGKAHDDRHYRPRQKWHVQPWQRSTRSSGFDPGGEFNPELRAGFEARDVVALNQKIAHRLRVTIVGKARRRNRLEDFVGGRMAGSIRSRVDPKWLDKMYRRCATLPGRRARRLHLADWQAIESIASDLRTELCEVASRHIVAKDPRILLDATGLVGLQSPNRARSDDEQRSRRGNLQSERGWIDERHFGEPRSQLAGVRDWIVPHNVLGLRHSLYCPAIPRVPLAV